jgi:hypothetical protein
MTTAKPTTKAKKKSSPPAKWKATADDWATFYQLRYHRGWQLAALSLGFAPTAGVIDSLPTPDAKKKLTDRRKLIKTFATGADTNGKLQYEPDSENDGVKNDPKKSAVERSFDVVKFVDFLKSLPTKPSVIQIDPELEKVAAHWRKHAGDSSSKTVDDDPAQKAKKDKTDKSALTRVERKLLTIILGLAIEHYEFKPVGVVGGCTKSSEMSDVYDRISEALDDTGVDVSAKLIEKYLLAASRRLGEDDNELKVVLDKIKERSR